jgi:hypothetical protein
MTPATSTPSDKVSELVAYFRDATISVQNPTVHDRPYVPVWAGWRVILDAV